jgi:hypothetical protein
MALMNMEAAIRLLIKHWETARPYFSAETRRELAELVRRMAFQLETGGDPEPALSEIHDLLRMLLPAGHPVRNAFESTRSATALEEHGGAARELLDRLQADPGDDEPPTAEEVALGAVRRLLSVPALGEDDLEDFGVDPREPGLIRLERLDGGLRWPEFQFAPDHRPIPLVLEINRLLDAEDDPWGVADWWLCPNAWLSGVPARMLGRIPGDRLLAAARAVDPGV